MQEETNNGREKNGTILVKVAEMCHFEGRVLHIMSHFTCILSNAATIEDLTGNIYGGIKQDFTCIIR